MISWSGYSSVVVRKMPSEIPLRNGIPTGNSMPSQMIFHNSNILICRNYEWGFPGGFPGPGGGPPMAPGMPGNGMPSSVAPATADVIAQQSQVRRTIKDKKK